MRLVILDSTLESLKNSFNSNIEFFIVNKDKTKSAEIFNFIKNKKYDSVAYMDHYQKPTNHYICADIKLNLRDKNGRIKLTNFWKHFDTPIIDYLGCSLLKNPSWKNTFTYLEEKTSKQFRASNDNTGNLKAGGDWVLESDNVNIEPIYFNEEINKWRGLLGPVNNATILFDYNNFLNGGTGNFTLNGGDTYTHVQTTETNNVLPDLTQNMDVKIIGSDGADTLNLNVDRSGSGSYTGNWTIDLGDGDDTLNLVKLKDSDSIDMGAGDDNVSVILTGIEAGGTGTDTPTLTGGTGTDTLSFEESSAGATLSLTTANASNFENLTGGSNAETLNGDDNANVLKGKGGADTLNGNGGDDILDGGTGDDTLNGGAGNNIAIYSGNKDDYTITPLGDNQYKIVGIDGEDTVENIQILRFDDSDVPIPLITSGTVGNNLVENSGSGQTIYTIEATHVVGSNNSYIQIASYAIGGTDANLLNINSSTGDVILVNDPDYKTKASYSFTVTAIDTAGNTSNETTVTFSIKGFVYILEYIKPKRPCSTRTSTYCKTKKVMIN